MEGQFWEHCLNSERQITVIPHTFFRGNTRPYLYPGPSCPLWCCSSKEKWDTCLFFVCLFVLSRVQFAVWFSLHLHRKLHWHSWVSIRRRRRRKDKSSFVTTCRDFTQESCLFYQASSCPPKQQWEMNFMLNSVTGAVLLATR